MAGLIDLGLGGLFSGAGSAIGGALSGAGSVIGGALSGAGSIIGGALTEGPKTIVNNFGMAGTAGTQKIKTGGGTLPAPKKTSVPTYNEKMPTEKLLAVAVNYLVSIDETLRTQINNDRLIYQKEVQAEKEAAVEGKNNESGTGVFSKLANFGKEKADKFDLAGKLITGGLILGTLGVVGLGQLDTSELDALKENIDAFKEKFSWLVPLGAIITGAVTGAMIAGPAGAVIGTLAAAIGVKLGIAADQQESTDAAAAALYDQNAPILDRIFSGYLVSQRGVTLGASPSANALPANRPTATTDGISVAGETVTGAQTTGQESFIPSGDQKVDFAMQYLMQNLGLKQFQAAGIVANLMAESELDTNAFNEAGGGRGAYGIAQWRGSRQDGLDAFAAARGKRRDDFETQLAWLVEEMKTTHRDTLPAMLATTSSADATTVFLDKFERPGAADRASSLQKRISFGMAAERGTSMETAQSTYSEPASLAAQSASASSGAGSFTSMFEMAKEIFGKGGGALIGSENYTTRPLNQNIGMPSDTINNLSKQIETQTIAGNIQQETQTSALAATAGQQSIIQASNDGSLGALDPNYPSGNDLIRTYLAHWKFAA